MDATKDILMIDAAMVGDDFIDVEYMNFEPVDVRSKNTISQLESLPLDAMNIILSYLTFQEFQRLSILCKRLNQAVSCSSHLHMTGQGYLPSLPPSFAHGHPNTEFRQPIMTQSRALHMVEYLPPEEDLRRLLQRFQSLNALHLQGLGAIGDNVVPILNESPASNTLKHISLHGCSLSYWCNQSFRLEHLQHLTIYGGSIRANICSLLQHSNDLRSLSIGQCAAIRDDSVSDLASLLQRKLERLTLHQCVRIRQPNLQFPKLEHLNLVGCFGLSSFPDFECPNLKEMDLSFWFAPEMDLIRNSINFSQRDVEGVVELELYKGNVIVRGRQSPKALYNADLASMDIEGGGAAFEYNPADANGFIRINAVRLKTYAALRAKFSD